MPSARLPYSDEADLVANLCRQAAKAALEIAERPLTVHYKDGDDRSPVTDADRAANDILMEGLSRHFPADGLCAEEASETHDFAGRRDKKRLWCIDPIDGTREFIAGSGQFAIMVGLAVDGRARFGAVYEPKYDCLFMGATELDGTRWAKQTQRGSTQPLQVSDVHGPEGIRLMVSRHSRTRTLDALCHSLSIEQRMPLGSVGLKVSRIARGEADLYACITDKIHEWDACGPAAILEGAGGQVTDLAGRPLAFNKPTTHMPHGLLASNTWVHERATLALQQAASSLPHLARLRG